MKNDFSIEVLTTDTDHGETEPYAGVVSNQWTNAFDPGIKTYYLKKKKINTRDLKALILGSNADYVYLNHLFSPYFVLYPLWLKFTGLLKGRIVLCPRGALYASALAVKPYKKKPFIKIFRLLGMHRIVVFHATNEREKQAIAHYFPGSKIIIADNLPATNQSAFVTCEKNTGILKCIYVARIVPIKNLLYLLNALEKVTAQFELSIVGPVEDQQYWEECREKIKELPENVSVNYLGSKTNKELPKIIQAHHVFILPTQGENFGHSIFEALLAGRPVLISDQTPWLDLKSKKAGWDLPLEKPAEFVERIQEFAELDQTGFDEWAQGAWRYASNFIQSGGRKQQYLQLFS